ncbi:ABC transporter ATP-binding protein [Aliidongia dinghuensis]|uniref:ABC transporter ATP-binding protein n=1 Tax=Aliidongia dinghuensis TaxID=1867774 RepID=A0A8J3E4N5_9PROT|nr:ABC transporter ATP-binding protein [Aliidongia dinghuensis]GGF25628.1 ABC transporter ATP-binding protein [Aliidongia dinghuensis]
MTALSLDRVAVKRDGDVTLALPGPGVTVLLGPNGAGKTELLETIMGLRAPLAGTIRLDGADIDRWPAERRARAGIGWCPEGRRVFPGLTVAENLELVAQAPAWERRRRLAMVLDYFPALRDRQGAVAWTLSGGQQQMLAVGRALMTAPRLLLLDEPSRGLAPVLVAELFAVLRRFADAGLVVLLAEQAVEAALTVADRAAVLERGRLEVIGRPDEIRDHPALARSFLG